jgi:DNA-binding SARP family transcriptional activator/TolB-like protein
LFTLKLFGGASIEDDAGKPLEGAASQRRRMAVLAVLTLARARGVTRDKLIAYLWPELDGDRARHLLSQSLYVLRRQLGEDALIAKGDDLRINPGIVFCDVVQFEDALALGNLACAVTLYRAPFLDGFFVADAPEFERWIDGERQRLARVYARALETLAEQNSQQGNVLGAVESWRQLAAHDPYSSRIALRLMQSLETVGDAAAALRHARIHTTLLREELGARPDPTLADFTERLAREPARPMSTPASIAVANGVMPGAALPPFPIPTPISAEYPVWPAVPTPPQTELAIGSSPALPRAAGRAMASRRIALAAVVVLVLVAGAWALRDRLRHGDDVSATTVAILPFNVQGSGEVGYLREGMVNLLTTNLRGAGGLRSVDPHALLSFVGRLGADPRLDPSQAASVAQRFGAGLFVLGDIIEVGGKVRINASLYDETRGQEPVAQAAVDGTSAQLFALVDGLTVQLLRGRERGPEARLARLAALTTPSLPALKAYLEGERRLRAGELDSAVAAFDAAVAADSSFALAYYRRAVAADWLANFDVAHVSAERAVQLSDRLSADDRQLLQAFLAWHRGAADEAERLYRSFLASHPDDVEGWYQLGEVLYHYAGARGHSLLESRAPFTRAAELDPAHTGATLHLLDLAAYEGDLSAFDSLLPRLKPEADFLLRRRAVRAFMGGAAAERDSILRELRRSSDGTVWVVANNLAMQLREPSDARRVAALLVEPARTPEARGLGHLTLAHLEVALGRWRAARARLDSAALLAPAAALETRALFAAFSLLPTESAELGNLRDALTAFDPNTVPPPVSRHPAFTVHRDAHPQIRLYLLGLIAARAGDVDGALRSAGDLQRLPGSGEVRLLAADLAQGVRAAAEVARGRPESALAALRATRRETRFELVANSSFYALALDRWQLAELLRGAGKDDEARGWYASLGQTRGDLFLLAPAQLRLGQIAHGAGDIAAAEEHLSSFVALWRECDPELRPLLNEGRTLLARMREGRERD